MKNDGDRTAWSYLYLGAAAMTGFLLFGASEAVLRNEWLGGVGPVDVTRVVWGGLLLALVFTLVPWSFDLAAGKLPRGIWRALVSSTLLAPFAGALYLMATESTIDAVDIAPAAFGAIAAHYLFWKGGAFDRPIPGFVGPVWVGSAAALFGLPAQYGPARWELNGLPIAMMLLTIVPLLVGFGVFLAADLRDRPEWLRRTTLTAAWLSIVGSLAALPHIYPGVMFYLKMIAAALAIAGAAPLVVFLARPPDRRLSRLSLGLVAMLFVANGAWVLAQPVSDRFGALGYDSVPGLAAAAASTLDDRDGDGFYASGVPIPDCDDRDATRYPGSHQAPCLDVEPRIDRPIRPGPDAAEGPRHAVVIMSDALRARDIYDPDKMPFVAPPTSGKVRFMRAYSPGNTTRLSVRPMLTGIAPPRFVLEPGDRPNDAAWWFKSLPEAFSSRWIVASEFAWMHDPEHWMSDDSIERYIGVTDETGRNIEQTIDTVVEHLDRLKPDERAAVAVFSTDPHGEYICDDGAVDELRCYDDEIAALDVQMRRLFDELEARGMRDETLVVLTSDHGEEFWEHGHFGQHASTLFEEQIHVPFIFWSAGLAGGDVEQPVSTMSFLPTLAEFGLARLDFGRAYRSLGPALRGEEIEAAPVVVHHWNGLMLGRGVRRSAVILGDQKLEYDWRTGHVRTVDLAVDAAELESVGLSDAATQQLLRTLHREHTIQMASSTAAFEE